MSKVIIYPTNTGHVAIVYPSPSCRLSIEQIAAKDVPAGVPYRLFDRDQIPADREYRDAWVADFSSPDGFGGISGEEQTA